MRDVDGDGARPGMRMRGGEDEALGMVGSGVPNVPGSRRCRGKLAVRAEVIVISVTVP